MKTKIRTLSPDGKTMTTVKTVTRKNKTKVKTTVLTERPLPNMKLFDKKVTKVKTKRI